MALRQLDRLGLGDPLVCPAECLRCRPAVHSAPLLPPTCRLAAGAAVTASSAAQPHVINGCVRGEPDRWRAPMLDADRLPGCRYVPAVADLAPGIESTHQSVPSRSRVTTWTSIQCQALWVVVLCCTSAQASELVIRGGRCFARPRFGDLGLCPSGGDRGPRGPGSIVGRVPRDAARSQAAARAMPDGVTAWLMRNASPPR